MFFFLFQSQGSPRTNPGPVGYVPVDRNSGSARRRPSLPSLKTQFGSESRGRKLQRASGCCPDYRNLLVLLYGLGENVEGMPFGIPERGQQGNTCAFKLPDDRASILYEPSIGTQILIFLRALGQGQRNGCVRLARLNLASHPERLVVLFRQPERQPERLATVKDWLQPCLGAKQKPLEATLSKSFRSGTRSLLDHLHFSTE